MLANLSAGVNHSAINSIAVNGSSLLSGAAATLWYVAGLDAPALPSLVMLAAFTVAAIDAPVLSHLRVYTTADAFPTDFSACREATYARTPMRGGTPS